VLRAATLVPPSSDRATREGSLKTFWRVTTLISLPLVVLTIARPETVENLVGDGADTVVLIGGLHL